MPSRKCSSLSIVGFICCILIIGYALLTLQETRNSNGIKDQEIVRRRDHENVLKEQLKVVYHHAQRVEEELKKERERHKKTRTEFLELKKGFYSNLTKSKHEAWTRFKALDSDHKMLKAEHEETKISYTSLQAQYKRLSTDHQRIVKEIKDELNQLKDNKDRESMSLQDRVQELYKKYVYYQEDAEKQRTYGKQMKEHYENCTKLTEQFKKHLERYVTLTPRNPGSSNDIKATQSTTEKSANIGPQKQQDELGNDTPTDDIDGDKNSDMDNHRYAGKAEETEIARNRRYSSIKSKVNIKERPTGKNTNQISENKEDSLSKNAETQKGVRMEHTAALQKNNEVFHRKEHPQLELPGGKNPADEVVNIQQKDVNVQVEEPGNIKEDGLAQQQNLDRVHKNERLDVKKVTLEDDENGDQNLDKDGGAAVVGGEQKETGNEDPPIKIDEDESEEKMVDEDEEKK